MEAAVIKLDRLIGILALLLQRETITSPELAERFEVSRRTINRDIEAICKAGIPLVTTRGRNGGISIMEGYAINKTLLTSSDLQALLTGLQGLDSIASTNRYQQLMEKLSAGQAALLNGRSIMVDLSSWYKLSLAPKIELIQRAINAKQKVRFDYHAPAGDSRRTIEPYLLVFQWSSWYVWGYCLKRNDFRLFKLNRINRLSCMEEAYTPRERPAFQAGLGYFKGASIHAVAIVHPQMKWRLIEEFGVDCFCEREDGQLLFQFDFVDKQNLIGWVFSFGDRIELMEPVSIRDEIIDLSKKILSRYEKHDT